MDASNFHTHEMNTSEMSVPVLVFGNGKVKCIDIIDQPDADGVALLMSKVDDDYIVNDNNLYTGKKKRPYFMLYFRDELFIDQLVNALHDIRNRVVSKK